MLSITFDVDNVFSMFANALLFNLKSTIAN
jgi:hypothetical protein